MSARIDWGYAPDFVDAIVRIVELPDADDFVIATGESHSVLEVVETAFAYLNLEWQRHVRQDHTLLVRPHHTLVGDSSRLRERTGWHPSVTFHEMVRLLVESEKNRNG